MPDVKKLINKTTQALKETGVKGLAKKTKSYLSFQYAKRKASKTSVQKCKDLLFISGCSLPHPHRYRVEHQIEQLEAFGLSCDQVYYADLTLDVLKYYRGFVFYRCPVLPVVEEFIKKAKENHKTVFYDIDDLVFDKKYTDKINMVKNMSKKDRELYDDGVIRMGKTMKLCEYGIGTTSRLVKEMERTFGEGNVLLNRNVASEEMFKLSLEAIKKTKRNDKKIILGYFSGSLTHNDDFNLIIPTLVELFEQYKNLFLKVVGELTLPKEFEKYHSRIISSPFVDWKELPSLIRSIDINLAPLENTIFNEAKSENKWTEAALVKVPTIASNVGAFAEEIEDEKTGLLCSSAEEWKEKLSRLIDNPELRESIGESAFDYAKNVKITTYSGKKIADFIKNRLSRNILFVLPSTNISGGIMVAEKHASVLKKNGFDVTLLNAEPDETNVVNEDGELNVVSAMRENLAFVDTMVATMWLTLEYVLKFPRVRSRKYLVQNFETNFYKSNEPEKSQANRTYNEVENVEYLTVSKWCKSWLEKDFGNHVKLAPNGINLNYFKYRQRDFIHQKIKILVEGNSKNHYKNVDESFKIIDRLDKTKFEIHYLSQEAEPKKSYYVDYFYQKVPYSEVSKIYSKCDILIKSSRLESFSYPPLEMMATGGFCVVAPNDGNAEYLSDGDNCLLYEPGNIDSAVEKINQIIKDEKLRNRLLTGAKITVHSRDWKILEKEILSAYND